MLFFACSFYIYHNSWSNHIKRKNDEKLNPFLTAFDINLIKCTQNMIYRNIFTIPKGKFCSCLPCLRYFCLITKLTCNIYTECFLSHLLIWFSFMKFGKNNDIAPFLSSMNRQMHLVISPICSFCLEGG